MSESFPISGRIDPRAFPFLLMDLYRNEATGSLRVEGPTYQKALYFRGGRVLFGSSNDPRDQLGAILIETGKISPEQLEDVNSKVAPGNPLARVLADSGFVNQRELGEAARSKVERILSDVLSYDEGNFEFEDGVLPRGAVDLKLATDKLTLSAARRIAERTFVLRFIDSMEVVLAPTAELHEKLPEIQEEAGGLPEQLDGTSTLKEAAGRAHLEEFEASKIACALLFLGLVERVEGIPDGTVADMPIPGAESPAWDTDATMNVEADTTFDLESDVEVASEEPAFFMAPEPAPGTSGGIGFEAEPVRASPGPGADETLVFATAGSSPAFDSSFGAADEPSTLPFGRADALSAEETPVPELASEEPATAPVAARPPSKEDLAALDALFNSRPPEGPLAHLETAPAAPPRWEPRFEPTPSRRARRSTSRLPLLLGSLGLLTAAGASAGWYYFLRDPAAAAVAQQVADPVLVPEAAPATAPVANDAETLNAASQNAPQASAAPEAAATEAPPETAPTATAPTTTAPPATVPTPTAPPATTTAKPPAKAKAAGLPDARTHLSAGRHDDAARGFAAAMRTQPRGTYSIQILVACSSETVAKAVANASAPELFVLPVNYQGRDCFRVCWGVYSGEPAAAAAVARVPDYFTKGGARPKAIDLQSLLP